MPDINVIKGNFYINEFGVKPARQTAGEPKLLTKDLRSGPSQKRRVNPPEERRTGPPNVRRVNFEQKSVNFI